MLVFFSIDFYFFPVQKPFYKSKRSSHFTLVHCQLDNFFKLLVLITFSFKYFIRLIESKVNVTNIFVLWT